VRKKQAEKGCNPTRFGFQKLFATSTIGILLKQDCNRLLGVDDYDAYFKKTNLQALVSNSTTADYQFSN
jgi:hypothetical protein